MTSTISSISSTPDKTGADFQSNTNLSVSIPSFPSFASFPSSTSTSTQPSPPKSVGGDMILISQNEYESMLNRIEKLQTAQDYNQKIIDRLIQRMKQLEQIYLAQQRANKPGNTDNNDIEGDVSMS